MKRTLMIFAVALMLALTVVVVGVGAGHTGCHATGIALLDRRLNLRSCCFASPMLDARTGERLRSYLPPTIPLWMARASTSLLEFFAT